MPAIMNRAIRASSLRDRAGTTVGAMTSDMNAGWGNHELTKQAETKYHSLMRQQTSRLRKNYVSTRELRWSARVGHRRTLPQDSRARQAGWARRVDLVHLVCFVHLVSLVQANKPNRPNKQEEHAGSRASRATVCGAGERFQHHARSMVRRGRAAIPQRGSWEWGSVR